MRQPKYQLRMDADLLRRLTEAGTTRVREVLEQAFPVLPGTTQDAPPVLPDPVSGTTGGDSGTTRKAERAARVLPEGPTGTTGGAETGVAGTTQEANVGVPVASGSTGSSSPVVPAWRAKLNEQIDKAKALKAARE